MFNEEDIRKADKRRMWIIIPAIAIGFCAVVAYLLTLNYIRSDALAFMHDRLGITGKDVAMAVLILPTFVLFLTPVLIAGRYLNQHKLKCPSCAKDISARTDVLLLTRCCPRCDTRIVAGGRQRTRAVYRRYRHRKGLKFFRAWLWAFPVLNAAVIADWFLSPSSWDNCPQNLWVPSLLGTVTAGWAFLRTFDRRYVPQLLVSIAFFGVGFFLFFQ